MPQVETVIFDLGKTLIPFSLEPLRPQLEREAGTRTAIMHMLGRLERGQVAAPEFRREICALTGLQAGEFEPWWNSIFERDWLVPQDWIRMLLGRYRCGLLSNTNALHFAFLKAEQPLLCEFDFRILSHEVGAAKPEARIYAAAEAAAHCAPGAICYFDDVPEFVEAARTRGWQAHLFTGAESVRAQLPLAS